MSEVLVNVTIIQHIDVLVRNCRGPCLQLPTDVGGKCTRQEANNSFQVQMLASLVALEDGSNESSVMAVAVPQNNVGSK